MAPASCRATVSIGADVIVSLDADFLGTWISPVEFTRGYTSRRRVDERQPAMSYHVQIESRMSLTGSNADRRVRCGPGEIGHLVTHLAVRLARRAGLPFAADGLAAGAVGADARRRLRIDSGRLAAAVW